MDRHEFQGLDLEEQRNHLQGMSLWAGIDLCRGLVDPAPLCFLLERALPHELTHQPERWAELLLDLPETHLAAVLKLAGLARPVMAAFEVCPLEKLVHFCQLDRYLKYHDSELRETYLQGLTAELEREGEVGERHLMRLSLKRLGGRPGLRERLKEVFEKAIVLLANRPKGVSLSNAEELLSRRVYTDPGHFLVELLQNAEDAGASRFELDFEPDQIRVWHNGEPFDLKDLVGITSIGQTTKRRQQIGFFGVGFKAVYEITDRPQIYSDLLAIEIVDISIPRSLSRRPEKVRSQGTTIVLRRRPQVEDALFERLLELDPYLLLTLTHLKSIRLTRAGGAGKVMERRDQAGTVSLTVNGDLQNFLLEEQWITLDQHQLNREPNRPTETRLMIGVRLDDQGRATPLPEGSATVFSYLPTREATGLRFFVQGHFDVPVDRERLSPESRWNRHLLQRVPDLIRSLVERHPPFWKLLPRVLEINSPVLTRFPGAIRRLLAEVAFIEDHFEGHLGSPAQTYLAPEAWLEFLDARAGHFLPASLTTQERELAMELGVREFGLEHLLATLRAGWRPLQLPVLLEHLAIALDGLEPGRADRYRVGLKELDLFWNRRGEPEIADRLVRVEPLLDRLFEEVEERLHQQLEESERASRLFAWLGGRTLDVPAFLEILTRSPERFVGPELYEVLLQVPQARLFGVGRLPIFGDGRRLAAGPGDTEGLWVYKVAGWREIFPHQPMLDAESLPGQLALHLRAPLMDGYQALARLSNGPEPEAPEKLLGLLLLEAQQLGSASIQQLVKLAVFLSRSGGRRPLVELALPPTDPRFEELIEGVDFLSQEGLSQTVVDVLGLHHHAVTVDLDTVLTTLEEGGGREALLLLAERAHSLTREQLLRCLRLSLYPDRPLGVYRDRFDPEFAYLAEPGLESALGLLGVHVVPGELRSTLEGLFEAAGWPEVRLDHLLRTLQRTELPPEALSDFRGALEPLLSRLSREVPTEVRQDLVIWVNGRGQAVSRRGLYPENAPVLPGMKSYLAVPLPGAEWSTCFPPVPLNNFLDLLLKQEALPGRALDRQPGWLDSLDKVVAVQSSCRLEKPWLVDADGALRNQPLSWVHPSARPLLEGHPLHGDLLHPDWPAGERQSVRPVPPVSILELVWKSRHQPAVRQQFYQWLIADEVGVLNDPEAAQFLMRRPLYLSAQGSWLAGVELVFDLDLPDLGLDCAPHPEIPAEFLSLLSRQLGIGRPDPEQLLETTLLPAFLGAKGPDQEAEVWRAMLKLLARLPAPRILELTHHLKLRDHRGQQRSSQELFLARDQREVFDEIPHLTPGSAEEKHVLLTMGVSQVPAQQFLIPALLRAGKAELQEWLELFDEWLDDDLEAFRKLRGPLRNSPWLPDGKGRRCEPQSLFEKRAEVENLIGSQPHCFAGLELSTRVGKWLGLRGVAEVTLDQVVKHLSYSVERQERVSPKVYRFLDRGLKEGRFTAQLIRGQLQHVPFVWCDEGGYFLPHRVLTTPTYRYFLDYRGFFEDGYRLQYLCSAFEIPAEIELKTVKGFLEEMASRRQAEVGQELAYALMACAAFVGERNSSISRDWAVLVGRRLQDGKRTLVAASRPGVVLSDTPSLEKLFSRLEGMVVLEEGDHRDRQGLEALYRALQIPQLRAAYQVTPDLSQGRDVSARVEEEIDALRVSLRALESVLPRVEAQRGERVGWIYKERFPGLLRRRGIRVYHDLKVCYQVSGVGSVSELAEAAYDPRLGVLYLDARVIQEPSAFLTSLAQALENCIVANTTEAQLGELLEILLLQGDRERMHKYLDRRHFPAAPTELLNPEEQRLRAKLLELLDNRFDRRLRMKYPEFREADFTAWREEEAVRGLSLDDPELIDRLAEGLDIELPEGSARRALALLLEAEDLGYAVSEPVAARPTAPTVSSTGATPGLESTGAARESGTGPSGIEQEGPAVTLFGKMSSFISQLGQQVRQAMPMPRNLMSPQQRPSSTVRSGPIEDFETLYFQTPQNHLRVDREDLDELHLYCVNQYYAAFEVAQQVWLPYRLPFNLEASGSGQQMTFKGRMGPGQSRLPLPLYSRLLAPPELGLPRTAVDLQGPDSSGLMTLDLKTGKSHPISYRVELTRPMPVLDVRRYSGLPPELLQPTCSSSQLPGRVMEFIEQNRQASPVEVVQRVTSFISENYAYDKTFSELPEVKAVHQRLPRGRGNHTLTLVHAAGDRDFLGRGICLELSVLAVELLRQMGVPALWAGVWALDQKLIHVADHAIALAVLPTPEGYRLKPLDPAFSQARAVSPMLPLRAACRKLGLPESVHGPEMEAALLQHLGLEDGQMLLRIYRGQELATLKLKGSHQRLKDLGLIEIDSTPAYRFRIP